ncbi:MAG: hypothetical protein WCT03_12760 [Candidatus Obscuribacterales bacterium]
MTTKSVIVTGEKAAQQSYGENIELANLIVSGAYQEVGTIIINQVLKGDKSWAGKTIKLANPIKMGCRQQAVPAIKNAFILLHAESKNGPYQSKKWSAIEIYDTPDQMAFLRCFIPLYASDSAQTERSRIIALTKLFCDAQQCHESFEADPKETFNKEFLFALKTMRRPENFELIEELYERPSLSAKDKLMLQQWMADTGDQRARAVLYQALKSKDIYINGDAVSRLTYNYQSSETDKAIAAVYNSLPAGSKPTAARYLIKRGASQLVSGGLNAVAAEAKATPFQKATSLNSQGKTKEAQAIFISILDSQEDNSYAIPVAINAVLDAGPSGRAKVLQSRLPWLNKQASTGNYLEAQEAALILRRLNSASCLAALLAILQKRESIFSKANQTATFAIAQLGAKARKDATAKLLQEIESNSAIAQKSDEQILLLLELAWLQDSADRSATEKLIAQRASWSGIYSQMQPLMIGLPSTDEGLFLIQKLKEKKLPPQALDWVMYRLGELQERRALDALLVEFEKPYSYSPSTAKEALEKITADKHTRGVLTDKLTTIALDSKSLSQANALELLAAIAGRDALPVVRQVIKTGQLDAKVRALNIMSRIGNKDDLVMLMPMANYWTSDRQLHYWVMQAIGEIKNR